MLEASIGRILGILFVHCFVCCASGLPAQPQVARVTTPVLGSSQIVTSRWGRMDSVVDGNLDGVPDAAGFWTSLKDATRGELRFFANDGTGSMTETVLLADVPIPANHPSPDVVIGDWDGDGRADLVLNHLDGAFTFFVSRAGGPVLLKQVRFLPTGRITSAVAGDFDGDRFADVAVMTTNQLYLFLNTSGLPSVLGSVRLGGGEDLHVMDVDADGAMDLLYTDTVRRELHLLKIHRQPNWTGPVASALAAYRSFPIPGTQKFHATCGDYDADGDDDVVVFLEGGTYQTIDQISAGTYRNSSWSPGGPATAMADIDGDGDLDGICCGSGGGTPSGRPNNAPVVFEVSRNDGGAFLPSVAVPNLGARHIAGAADMNGDGRMDLVAGRGILFDVTRYEADVTWTTVAGRPALPRTDGTVDHDGDGDLDILSCDSRVIFRNRGDGRFDWHTLKHPSPPAGVRFDVMDHFHGDWDGDGDVDVLIPAIEAATGRLLGMHQLHNEDGTTFSDAGPITPRGDNFRFAWRSTQEKHFVADLNGDGLDDIVTNNPGATPSMRMFINKGNRRFEEIPHNLRLYVNDVRDLDADGCADMVTHSYFVLHGRGGASVYWGQKSGQLGPRTDYLSARHSDALALVDYDGDGDLDVYSKYGTSSFLGLFENDGSGVFTQHLLLSNMRRSEFHVHDYDGDGRQDVAVLPGGEDRTAYIFTSPTPGAFEWREQVLAEPFNHRLGDFDGDGDVDIAGARFLASVRHHGSAAGGVEQFGVSRAGASGMEPRLGASGPFRPGHRSSIYLGHAAGVGAAVIVAGPRRANLIDFPWLQVNTYVNPQPVQVLVRLDSAGRFSTSVQLTPGIANATLVFQAYVLDATAPSGFASTNGLEVRYGN